MTITCKGILSMLIALVFVYIFHAAKEVEVTSNSFGIAQSKNFLLLLSPLTCIQMEWP